jgi:LmbE family N-acetylglucosaminyl deacetylase
MLPLGLGGTLARLDTILCLGSHCDDIEIGCSGTVLKLLVQCPAARVHWVVFSSDGVRAEEARLAAGRLLAGANAEVRIERFRNGFFPYIGAEIKEYFERLKQAVAPDVVFTHYRNDLHQDHRTISDLTWNTFRNHLVLEYEIPKYDGDIGTPNVYVPLSDEIRDRKVATVMECFSSQRDKPWFTPETFNALMRLRGVESNSPSGYAEAFYGRKLVV